MSTKAKLALVLGVVVLVYFLLGSDAEPVEVEVADELVETEAAE